MPESARDTRATYPTVQPMLPLVSRIGLSVVDDGSGVVSAVVAAVVSPSPPASPSPLPSPLEDGVLGTVRVDQPNPLHPLVRSDASIDSGVTIAEVRFGALYNELQ